MQQKFEFAKRVARELWKADCDDDLERSLEGLAYFIEQMGRPILCSLRVNFKSHKVHQNVLAQISYAWPNMFA